MQKRTILAGLGIAAALVATAGTGGAMASKAITGHDIANGTVHKVDLSKGLQAKIAVHAKDGVNGLNGKDGVNGTNGHDGKDGKDGAQGERGQDGENGHDGRDGKDGVSGLYYVTAHYGTDVDNDPTVGVNGGAIATVACKNPTDHAVAGGVQTLGIDGGAPAAVASSFPGRMDWTTNTPKPNRFDGWIVQFDAQRAPVKADIWVTCATDTTITQYEVPVS